MSARRRVKASGINEASTSNLDGGQGGSHPVTASFFKQMQVLALPSLLCTFKVGLPAHHQLEQIDVFRGVHYNVGSEVSQQGCWEEYSCPGKSATAVDPFGRDSLRCL